MELSARGLTVEGARVGGIPITGRYTQGGPEVELSARGLPVEGARVGGIHITGQLKVVLEWNYQLVV